MKRMTWLLLFLLSMVSACANEERLESEGVVSLEDLIGSWRVLEFGSDEEVLDLTKDDWKPHLLHLTRHDQDTILLELEIWTYRTSDLRRLQGTKLFYAGKSRLRWHRIEPAHIGAFYPQYSRNQSALISILGPPVDIELSGGVLLLRNQQGGFVRLHKV